MEARLSPLRPLTRGQKGVRRATSLRTPCSGRCQRPTIAVRTLSYNWDPNEVAQCETEPLTPNDDVIWRRKSPVRYFHEFHLL